MTTRTVKPARIAHEPDPNRIDYERNAGCERIETPLGPVFLDFQCDGQPDGPGHGPTGQECRYYTGYIHLDHAIVWRDNRYTRVDARFRWQQTGTGPVNHYEHAPHVVTNDWSSNPQPPPSVRAAIEEAIRPAYQNWVAGTNPANHTRDARNRARQREAGYLEREAERAQEKAQEIRARMEE